ncbi:DeoR/GlpR family DNA-binding transcription regulator [Corynebacterium epidermidicanis]|uniref:Lactose phosphotransferase system repressor n=1 Tax=Corynebacterium epidermidicanis TaxID=1050174 RepID=A0A0G3GRZ4_9CORY|nr:DeoR/GlpR family DNA-binding transcription regulator [Corynebacterium epidermidicanis]AKK03330.1 transcriptional regulator, DeoR family [Corynebacterium epidermidicanis]
MLTSRERQADIVAHATKTGHVSVTTLAQQFGVTPETIRRDLKTLERQGAVSRVHGGAVATQSDVQEPGLTQRPFGTNPVQNMRQKRGIATAAVRILPDAEISLFVDSGSTTSEFIRGMAEHRPSALSQVTIVTSSISIASLCADTGFSHIHVVAGRLRPHSRVLVGDQTITELSQLRADYAVFSANGVSCNHGFSTPDPAEAAVKSTMISRARTSVALCDSAKINKDFLVTFARFSDIDVFVTDTGIPAEFAHFLHEHQIQVEQAT